MNTALQSLLTFVLLYKYTAIFVIVFAAALSIPVPSGAILIASSFFASEGYMSFPLVFLVGLIANILGDTTMYALSRKYGMRIFTRLGLRRFLASEHFHTLEAKLTKHPKLTIFSSRFVGVFTPLVNVLSGMVPISFGIFFVVECVGELVDVAFLCACGFFFGSNWVYLETILSNVGLIITSIVVLIFVFYWHKGAAKRGQKKIKMVR